MMRISVGVNGTRHYLTKDDWSKKKIDALEFKNAAEANQALANIKAECKEHCDSAVVEIY